LPGGAQGQFDFLRIFARDEGYANGTGRHKALATE
jgi:hypothetical protein